jgi:hypothetical protein
MAKKGKKFNKKVLLLKQAKLEAQKEALEKKIEVLMGQITTCNTALLAPAISESEIKRIDALTKSLNYQLGALTAQVNALSRQLEGIDDALGDIAQAQAEFWDGTIDFMVKGGLGFLGAVLLFPFTLIGGLFGGKGSKAGGFLGLAVIVILLVVFAPQFVLALVKTKAFETLLGAIISIGTFAFAIYFMFKGVWGK